MKNVQIINHTIGDNYPVFFIAEIGGNFKTMNEAKALIDLCCRTKVDAIKLQTFKAKTHISKHANFDMPNVKKQNQLKLMQQYELSEEMHHLIFEYAKINNLLIFSTPSHKSDVDFLETLNVPCYKLGSDDAVNIPLIQYISNKGKPLLLSTGMSTLEEVKESVEAFIATGNDQLILLHCVRYYPCERDEVNLKAINTLKLTFNCPVGYSDHTQESKNSLSIPILAAACGANVIEKHIILSKKLNPIDYPDLIVSADEEELMSMVNQIRQVEISLGDGIKKPSKNEAKTIINDRKSLVIFRPIPANTVITEEMVCEKRPGIGIPPKFRKDVIGKKTIIPMEEDHLIKWEEIK